MRTTRTVAGRVTDLGLGARAALREGLWALTPWPSRVLAALVLLLLAPLAGAQNRVGQIDYAQGLTSAQTSGAQARLVSRGDALFKGDTITTTDKGYAVLTLDDGTRLTLRPSTTFAVDDFAHDQGAESAVLHLIKGGLRAITGLIGRRNPAGFKLVSPTATIGIRGTRFDARICGEDCREEQAQARPRQAVRTPVPPPDTVVARVVRLTGAATLTRNGEAPHVVSEGTPILVGDQLVTASDSALVLGFRDQSRVSLEPKSAFKVDQFEYHKDPERDNFAVRLLRGGLRAFTGLIGKTRPGAVEFRTATATIGIRGTGADISCQGPCAAVPEPVNDACRPNVVPPTPPVPVKKGPGTARPNSKIKTPPAAAVRQADVDAGPACPDGLFVHNWDGAVTVTNARGTLDIPLDVVAFGGTDGNLRLLSVTPGFMNEFVSPRPDGVDLDWNALFGGAPYDGADGLYTLVRDGYVLIDGTTPGGGSGGHLDLGPGEAAFVGPDGTPQRVVPAPAFLLDDPYPAPEVFDPDNALVLQLFGATMGNPGQEVCEIK